MRFGTFYEHQIPRPWTDGDEAQLFAEALDQVELADRLGFHHVWAVEHHFLEEYSHSSAPGIFLAAASQRTKCIRLGHGIRLMPPAYNAPARVAEMLATLDLVSGGRVDWGTGNSASRVELEGFGVDPEARHGMWQETVREVARMLSMSPYPGFEGEHFSMPPRNVVPKPIQRPHPPLWLACPNRQAIREAARRGLGALTFSFLHPGEAEGWVSEYYEIFEKECDPIGEAVNPNIAMVAGFGCHEKKSEAVRRCQEGFAFFKFALAYYYQFARHKVGVSDLWAAFEAANKVDLAAGSLEQFDTPKNLRELYRGYEEAGVDQVIFVQQAGRTKHKHICDALELFGTEVLGDFDARHAEREAAKAKRLAPAIAAAMERKAATEAARGAAAYGLQDRARLLLLKKAGALGDE